METTGVLFITPGVLRIPIVPVTHSVAPRRYVKATAQSSSSTARTSFDIGNFSDILYKAQASFCSQLEAIDSKERFCSDQWQSDSGSGNTRVLQQGRIFEKAGVNVSVVEGVLSEGRANAMRSRGRDCQPGMLYSAAALSFVFHAQSPFIPTLRGDVRVFATGDQFWAGGGVDLTVFYINREQIANFHKHWKNVCDDFDPSFYPLFKRQCDDYFFLPARGEHRGVGGIFYDDVVLPESQLLSFQSRLLSEFMPSFSPILQENSEIPWTEDQKRWQRIRRGRYLEFNLLEDRGVRFGLTGAKPSRTDSIMISAPPSVEWPYHHIPLPDSPEDETVKLLGGHPVEWVKL